jgi:DNA-binding HxlR family transcriptional regulator
MKVTMMKGYCKMNTISTLCPVNAVSSMLMGKWKMIILWNLHSHTRRFNELQKVIPDISHGVLVQQLKELEKDQMILRKVYNEVPPKVEYSLTEIGESFIPIMIQLMEWGAFYVSSVAKCNTEICIVNQFPCHKCHELISLKKGIGLHI